MPGEQKGKKHAPGAGRPPTFTRPKRLSITIESDHAAHLQRVYGSVSLGIKRLAGEDLARHQSDERFQRRERKR